MYMKCGRRSENFALFQWRHAHVRKIPGPLLEVAETQTPWLELAVFWSHPPWMSVAGMGKHTQPDKSKSKVTNASCFQASIKPSPVPTQLSKPSYRYCKCWTLGTRLPVSEQSSFVHNNTQLNFCYCPYMEQVGALQLLNLSRVLILSVQTCIPQYKLWWLPPPLPPHYSSTVVETQMHTQ